MFKAIDLKVRIPEAPKRKLHASIDNCEFGFMCSLSQNIIFANTFDFSEFTTNI